MLLLAVSRRRSQDGEWEWPVVGRCAAHALQKKKDRSRPTPPSPHTIGLDISMLSRYQTGSAEARGTTAWIG
jgi:hypothetical protein